MHIVAIFVVVIALAVAIGGRNRSIRGICGSFIGGSLGFVISVGYLWFHPLLALNHSPTFLNMRHALLAVDWLMVSVVTGCFATGGAACGFFLQGRPSKGADAFLDLNGAWELITFWRH